MRARADTYLPSLFPISPSIRILLAFLLILVCILDFHITFIPITKVTYAYYRSCNIQKGRKKEQGKTLSSSKRVAVNI